MIQRQVSRAETEHELWKLQLAQSAERAESQLKKGVDPEEIAEGLFEVLEAVDEGLRIPALAETEAILKTLRGQVRSMNSKLSNMK
jgi:hypothetical protein